jgi:hypothetical protein
MNHRNGQGTPLRTAIRGELMVSRLRNKRNRMNEP